MKSTPFTPAPKEWPAVLLAFFMPLGLAVVLLGGSIQHLSVPIVYNGNDDTIWQLMLTKMLRDTGWILWNPYLGAPGIASWHHNAAAQTSALHSAIMWLVSPLFSDAVQLQQAYYLFNFPAIGLSSYLACRLLGANRLFSIAAGMLYAFATIRFSAIIYSFIPNYFPVPLALVAVIWVYSGHFLPTQSTFPGIGIYLRQLLSSRDYRIAFIAVLMVAASDGYYAFFTLLLLCLSAATQFALGGWRKPTLLIPGALMVAGLLFVAALLNYPLIEYKHGHASEFYPNGIEDPSLVKHAFEAEIYSSTFKTLVAPIPGHQIPALARIGTRMVESSDETRKFPSGPAFVTLGSLGSLLLLVLLLLHMVPRLRFFVIEGPSVFRPPQSRPTPQEVLSAMAGLGLFIFLSSIVGGFGTIIALSFPAIRAYNRFPLFLLFILYAGASITASRYVNELSGARRRLAIAAVIGISVLGVFDQIPRVHLETRTGVYSQFVAERALVRSMESQLKPGSMIYQYPYAQYLRPSKYYSWGSFSYLRPYLHSRTFRWSNGGAKNSPADDWNYHLSLLPFDQLLPSIEAVGFKAMIFDRSVVGDQEYQPMLSTLRQRGYAIHEDPTSKFAWVQLRNPGFQLEFEATYKRVESMTVTDSRHIAPSQIPPMLDKAAVLDWLAKSPTEGRRTVHYGDHPELFTSSDDFARSHGEIMILPYSGIKGSLSCEFRYQRDAEGHEERVVRLLLQNQSSFDWNLGVGRFPLNIGFHLHSPVNPPDAFDNGFRVPSGVYVPRKGAATIDVPWKSLQLKRATVDDQTHSLVEFALVQDGNAWIGSVNCSVRVP